MTTESNPEPSNTLSAADVTIKDLQLLIREMYYEKDMARGVSGTFMWLIEEIGELASALRDDNGSPESKQHLAGEFSDVIAWLVTIANVAEIDLADALIAKYGKGCPGCAQLVCRCPDKEKP